MAFKALRQLPLKEKIAIMGRPASKPSVTNTKYTHKPSATEISRRWQNLDPVDMESVERDHFLKTGQVLRTSHVEATPAVMSLANRESQVLGMQFLEELETLSTSDFVSFIETLLTAPVNGVFHRDMKHDAQFMICKKILALSSEEVGANILSISMVLNRFEPELEIPNRVWRRKIVPAIRQGLVQLDRVPSSLFEYDSDSRMCALMAEVLKCGRVKVTNQLLEYFSIGTPNQTAMMDLLDAFVVSGSVDIALLDRWNLSAMNELTTVELSKLIQTRLHFRLDPLITQSLVEQMSANLDIPALATLPVQSQLTILDCLFTEDVSEPVVEWANRVCSRIPDVDILSQLGASR